MYSINIPKLNFISIAVKRNEEGTILLYIRIVEIIYM